MEIEEEFDPVRLGLLEARPELEIEDQQPAVAKLSIGPIPPPRAPASIKTRLSRTSSGRYRSADWAPENDLPLAQKFGSVEARNGGASPMGNGDRENGVDVRGKDSAEGPSVDYPASAGVLVNAHSQAAGRADSTAVDPENTTPALPSAMPSAYETDTTGPLHEPSGQIQTSSIHRNARTFIARIVVKRRPSGRPYRKGIKVIRPLPPVLTTSRPPSINVTEPEPRPTLDSMLSRRIHEMYGAETLAKIKVAAKIHGTTGDQLPEVLRDLFPALSDRRQALNIINESRTVYGLPPLPVSPKHLDRVALHKALAQMRETLYLEIASALVLPDAPLPKVRGKEDDDKTGDEDRLSLSLTPSSLDTLSRTLPKMFPADKSRIRSVLANHLGVYGENGDVVWVGGVGRMKSRLKEGVVGRGYRGEEGDGPLHVFVDHSNILYGLLHHLYSDPRPLPPRHQRILSLPCLHLLLTRGRSASPGALNLVASSPLHQDLDPLVRLGWEVSVMKRVEIREDEVVDATAARLTPKAKAMTRGPSGDRLARGANGPSTGTVGVMGSRGLRRFKEQGVDEVLTLKILQLINRQTRNQFTGDHTLDGKNNITPHQVHSTNGDAGISEKKAESKHGLVQNQGLGQSYRDRIHQKENDGGGHTAGFGPCSTIVLATGDARGGQFNKEGFLGAVREAVSRGWIVELWSFSAGLSRAWKETAKREGWDGRFRMYLMDDFAGELVEVNEEAD